MYRCQSCGVIVQSGERANWITTKVRRKRYPFRAAAIPVQGKGRKRKRRRDDQGGIGIERMNHIKVCNACFERLDEQGPEVVEDIAPEIVEEAPVEEEVDQD